MIWGLVALKPMACKQINEPGNTDWSRIAVERTKVNRILHNCENVSKYSLKMY